MQLPVWIQQLVNWIFIALDSNGIPWQAAAGFAAAVGAAIATAFRLALG